MLDIVRQPKSFGGFMVVSLNWWKSYKASPTVERFSYQLINAASAKLCNVTFALCTLFASTLSARLSSTSLRF